MSSLRVTLIIGISKRILMIISVSLILKVAVIGKCDYNLKLITEDDILFSCNWRVITTYINDYAVFKKYYNMSVVSGIINIRNVSLIFNSSSLQQIDIEVSDQTISNEGIIHLFDNKRQYSRL